MTADKLHEITRAALQIVGSPVFTSPGDPDANEELIFLPAAHGHEPGRWVLASAEDEGAKDDAVDVDVEMAADLIRSHLRDYLATGGWQVHLAIRRGRATWRLADCVSPAEGGGDRLDDDYPGGEDELLVLCRSVEVISRHRG
ncbi:MAG: hypothetical protein HBSAPP02_15070 [Phycisphaerae bacterium]|nr:MAG: hypothetical protein HRU71_07250 [Planctomycetia bacterium]RIK71355.1 MAG: hypothetical protein DCC66_01850 [Planctomycetota bacterium]GJQ26475.1 MAG: hypothetical protein HBSAPP02_15070 [Phycisphaerae bacterium]